MEPREFNKRKKPEAEIQEKIIKRLRYEGWFVKSTHGNLYQSGFPDLFACHNLYGIRWIEVKLPGMKGSKFTPAQLDTFPKMIAHGAGVWVLTGDSDHEFQKLRRASNFHHYLMNEL